MAMESQQVPPRRVQHARRPSKPPIRLSRDKKPRPDKESGIDRAPQPPHTTAPGRVRTTKNSVDITRRTREVEPVPSSPTLEDDPNARYFRVGNVGTGGKLYLKPSRAPMTPTLQSPTTPSVLAERSKEDADHWQRQSISSEISSIPLRSSRDARQYHAAAPPISIANHERRRRLLRSNSFSGMSEKERARISGVPRDDSMAIAVGAASEGLNLKNSPPRARSSLDFSRGLLDLPIPHYRLGTPLFTDVGSAYIRNSVYTISTHDRSSMFSTLQIPNAHVPTDRPATRVSSTSPYVSGPLTFPIPRTEMTIRKSATVVTPMLYDKIERSPNDPAIVRFHPTTHRIVAATAGRLVAEITSPQFLDYELLSDFFLTFRGFMFAADLLEYLLARLRWALDKTTDARRIVRVRTFVALRHWILNYFADDFLTNHGLRQRLCDIVNDITYGMRQRPDRGGMDMSIVGELKKCWRRTSATFWPIPDAMETSPDAKIWPGGDMPAIFSSDRRATRSRHPYESYNESRPSSWRVNPSRDQAMAGLRDSMTRMLYTRKSTTGTHPGSFPASPMSEDSLQVLSCSVPFLRNLKTAKALASLEAPRMPVQQKPIATGERSAHKSHQHKRSGSFTDALRDSRTPLPSGKVDSIDIRDVPRMAFVGGLIRGLLLKPSPSNLNLLVPIAPVPESRLVRFADSIEDSKERPSQASMKKLVGEVRRALSTRKPTGNSPTRVSRSAQSSHSPRLPAQSARNPASPRPDAWQQFRGPTRYDMLGETVAESYEEVFRAASFATEQGALAVPEDEYAPDPRANIKPPALMRFDSNFTTGSRSIVIMDATGEGRAPPLTTNEPELNEWSDHPDAAQPDISGFNDEAEDVPEADVAELDDYIHKDSLRTGQIPLNAQPQDQLHVPRSREDGRQAASSTGQTWHRVQARKSSSAYPIGVDIPSGPHGLRRRPGGDLKAADHVHELEPLPRANLSDTYSLDTSSPARLSTPPNELSGTHFSSHEPLSVGTIPIHAIPVGRTGKISLLDTHSSLHGLRPSLQAQVSQLATLPDNYEGVEDALLRLEGRNHGENGGPPSLLHQNISVSSRQDGVSYLPVPSSSVSNAEESSLLQSSKLTSPYTETHDGSMFRFPNADSGKKQQTSQSLPNRAQSVPVTASLFGVASSQVPRKHRSQDTNNEYSGPNSTNHEYSRPHSARLARSEDDDSTPRETNASQRSQVNLLESANHRSFLLRDDESLSDISTAMGDEPDDRADTAGMSSFYFDDTTVDRSGPWHIGHAPPTPPSTISLKGEHRIHNRSHTISNISDGSHLRVMGAGLNMATPSFDATAWPVPPSGFGRAHTPPATQQRKHLPFVLAFDANITAEQLTIIEKDALDEIDWKDLIGMRWHQNLPAVRDWVEFLKLDGYNGIDIVVARFNLVVKWVVSECVLTEAASERAKCITRFIHIACHCRRLRNFASMYQITLALLSTEVTRMRRTWALVEPFEKQKLLDLEKLCQPVRNFRNLRAEMESGSPEEGCIPFIGLYTHDLMYNAQKPTRVDSPYPHHEPVINFERFQTAAIIVKGLLRLIEASSKYAFRPHPEALSRCLWLATLSDRDITIRSRTLEP